MTDSKYQSRFSQVPAEAVLDQDLTETDFRVLSIIGLYLNRDKEAWPMQSTVAEQLGKSQTTVNRSIKRLEAKGYISSRKKFENQPGTHRVYRVEFVEGGIGKNDYSGNSSKGRISGNSSKGRISHKNNPEEQPNKKNKSKRFEEAWDLYRSCRKKANQVRKSSEAEWQRAVAKAEPEKIISAIKIEVESRNRATGWVAPLPNMVRWLKEERWNSVFDNSPQNQTAPETASIIPTGPTESIDELLAKRDREMGGGQATGIASANLSGVQPHPKEETLEMFERDPGGDQDARFLSSL
ncbi:MAG: helix-turn-helix domain-containing protein [Pseudomonadota bacterium]